MKEQPTQAQSPQAAPGVPEIHEHEHRRYKLIQLDDTQIERTAAELCEGSKLLKNRELWVANFRATIGRVRQWCDTHRDKLQLALVDIRSSKVVFYFVPVSERYNLSLGKLMTALETEMAGSAGIGYVETLQVPRRSLERFVGEKSLLVWTADADEEVAA